MTEVLEGAAFIVGLAAVGVAVVYVVGWFVAPKKPKGLEMPPLRRKP